jgi:molecular chaperone GrpE
MTGNDQDKSKEPSDLASEIERTMAEAEAAVDAVQATTGAGPAVVEGATPNAVDVVEDEHAPDVAEAEGEEEIDEVGRLQAEVEAVRDKWLRAVADLDNYKKRVKRDIDDAVMRATQGLLEGFLPTVDNLERALEVAGNEVPDQLVSGIKMVRDEFIAGLRRHGIEPVESVGKPFDPSLHDALQQVDSDEHEPGTVVREFEKGYRYGERLLRPARVVVAGAGSKGGASERAEA